MGSIELVAELKGHTNRTWNVTWHPKRPILASASGDQTVRLWSSPDGKEWKCSAVLSGGHKRTIRSVAWNPDGKSLATASFDSTTGIWERNDDSNDWECVATLEGHENEVKAVGYSASGSLLATCSRDKSVWIWEVEQDNDFECLSVLQEHSQDVKMITWHPSEELLVSASYDDTIKFWADDGDDWSCIDTITGHEGTVWSIDFDAAGERLASASADLSVKIYEKAKPGQQASNCSKAGTWYSSSTLVGYHDRCIYSVGWSKIFAGGDLLASTGEDGRICIYEQDPDGMEPSTSWRLASRREQAHGVSDVNCIAWCKAEGHGDIFATAGDDGMVRIWRFVS